MQVLIKVYGLPKEALEKMPASVREANKDEFKLNSIRIEVLNDVEWESLKISRTDVGTEGYVVA